VGASRPVRGMNGDGANWTDVLGLVVFAICSVAFFLALYWIVEAVIVSIVRKAARAIDEDREERRYYDTTEHEDLIAERERKR
jgi:hypothetical protein